MYGADDSRFMGYVNQTGANITTAQPGVKSKNAIVVKGNATQIVPDKQKIKKGKYD